MRGAEEGRESSPVVRPEETRSWRMVDLVEEVGGERDLERAREVASLMLMLLLRWLGWSGRKDMMRQ